MLKAAEDSTKAHASAIEVKSVMNEHKTEVSRNRETDRHYKFRRRET